MSNIVTFQKLTHEDTILTATSIDGYMAYEILSFDWFFQFGEAESIKGAPLLPRNMTIPPMKLIDVQQHGDVFLKC